MCASWAGSTPSLRCCSRAISFLPTQSESFGLAARGDGLRRAVVSWAGGLPEIIRRGRILEPAGSVEAMGRRAVELLRDSERHRAMAERAAARARDYAADLIVPRYESLYQSVIG
jgi:glycosyltransferase involved in cell wall biosynthesis